jgi:hypothetical protein
MSPRSTLTLFPLLSIMVAAMGTQAFLAMVLVMQQGHEEHAKAGEVLVHIALDHAPPKAIPLAIECRAEGVLLHEQAGPPRFFSSERLRREVMVVKDLRERGAGQAGASLTRDQEWLFFKAVIERDPRLKDTLTLALHLIEMSNLKGSPKARPNEFYPVLLVYPDGVDAYELTSFLMELTSRLPVEAEPMSTNWTLAATSSVAPREFRSAWLGERGHP